MRDDDEEIPGQEGFVPFSTGRARAAKAARSRLRAAGATPCSATVVEMVGKWVRVRMDSAEPGLAERRLRVKAEVVAGDRVWLEGEGDMQVVGGFEPRRTELRRSGNSGVRVVCANADVLAIVSATQDPPFRPGLVDRMLVAASSAGMTAALVLNKCDTGMPEEVLERLALYEDLGLPVFMLSALQGKNMEEFREFLHGRTTVLAGHSGVGKSSLLRALVPNSAQKVGHVDEWGRGRHTTTGACAFDLPDVVGKRPGVVVDLPGVREYGVGFVLKPELRTHFPELVDLRCRYADCLHNGEDGCIAADHSDAIRLESYQKLLEECV